MSKKINGKALLSSKVFWFNALFILVTIAGWFGFGEFQPDENVIKGLTTLGAIVNILLRLKTEKPITRLT